MPGFVKPTRKVVNIEDAFGELIGKKLIKDLHDNEEICPVCHGTGLRIEDNPYGLSDDPDKRAGQFPYNHQSIRFCPNCYNGVVRFCPDCGKQIPRYRTLCDCDAVVQRRQQEENRKEKERLEKAEKSRMRSDHYLQWHKATFTLTTKDISAVGRISLIAGMKIVKSSRRSRCTYGEPKR